MKHTAFTVWELLAVVVIVVVVAILLLPVFAVQKTRDPSRDCLSHEKQLALAVMQYSQDNDGHLPDIAAGLGSTNTWRNVIYPYCKSKNIYQCPSRKDKAIGPDGFPRSYAANYTGAYSGGKGDTGNGVFSGPGSEGISIKSIPALQNLIMLCEVSHHSTPDFNIDNLAVFNPHSHTLWAGHSGGSNYAFADGHAKWLKPESTKDFWHRRPSVPLSPAAAAILADAQERAGDRT